MSPRSACCGCNAVRETRDVRGRRYVAVAESGKAKVEGAFRTFAYAPWQTGHRVLISSYETLRNYRALLPESVDLVVCDEAHRLKNNKAQTSACACSRRGTRGALHG